MGLSIAPRLVWARIRLILQTYKIATYLYFHPIRAENLQSHILGFEIEWYFLTRFRILTEKWDGKRVFEAAGSAWGPTSTFTKNAGKCIHTDNHIELTLTTPSFSWLAFFIPKFRKSSDFRCISNLTRLPRVARLRSEAESDINVEKAITAIRLRSHWATQSTIMYLKALYFDFCSSYNALVFFGRARFRSTRPFKILARNKRK